MRRRFAYVLVSAALVLSTLAVAEPAGAKKPLVTGRGHVACSISGKLKYSAPLTLDGQDDSTSTMAGKLVCSLGTTGNPAVTVVSGKATGSSPADYASCLSPSPRTFNFTVHWKAAGGKVVDSAITLGPVFDQNSAVAHYRGGVVTGSYAEQTPEANISWAKRCGKKGLRNTKFFGSFDLDFACDGMVRTEVAPGQVQDDTRPDDGLIWWVVIPECPFTATTHPTGTISWDYGNDPRNGPHCSGANVPLTDSGSVGARGTHGQVYNDTPFWGVNTGINLRAGEQCYGTHADFVLHYSGDSRYRPYDVTP